jgi:hypothetical protein
MNIRAISIAVAFSFSILSSVCSAASQQFPPNMNVLGREWGQYILSLPKSVNPFMEGPADDRCRIGQHGAYWFLGAQSNGLTTRTCTMPTRRLLFFPVVSVISISTGETTPAELLSKISPCLDAATDMEVTLHGTGLPVDGVDFPIGVSNRVTSPGFNVVLPADNLYDVIPQVARPAVTDGYYVLLSPLGRGTYSLRVKGTVPGVCTDLPTGFAVDVTYQLKVSPGTPLLSGDTDEIEPNSTCQSAQDLQSTAIPTTVAGYKAVGDVDFFKFSATPGAQLTASLGGDVSHATPLQSTAVGVFSSACAQLTSNSTIGGSTSADFTVPADGKFIVAATACCDLSFTGSGTLEGAYLLNVSE